MTSVTYTAVPNARRGTAEPVAKLLHEHWERLGTRRGTRALGAFKQAVLVLRWFIDGARLVQLARDNGISTTTAYRYLHEGLTVLADHAPDLATALERAPAAGYTHLNLDGTVIRTDCVAAPGPNKADLWWSGKHRHHGGNVQVISAPDGWPIWVSPVRPGRETPSRSHRDANSTSGRKTFNKVIRGIHGVAERANALFKVTFKALRRVSLDLGSITRIVRAARALLQMEHGRTT
ncbi:transposase family protein [Streptomyces mirabilis]|uniref:transposase family protein n=1 Tax=Streptomyces mirabilis TaxID=68239 RepID=UPI00369CCAFE